MARLALGERFLRPLPLGDVARRAAQPDDAPVSIAERRPVELVGHRPPGGQEVRLHRGSALAVDAGDGLSDSRTILLGEEPQGGPARQRRVGVAGDLVHAPVPPEELAVEVEDEEDVGDGVEGSLRQRPERVSGPIRRLTPTDGIPELDLVGEHGGEVFQHPPVLVVPRPGLVVDHAEGAEDLPRRRPERHAEVGDDAEVLHRAVVAHERVLAGIVHDERRGGCHDVLAERVRERGLAHGRLGQSEGALEELPMRLDEADERDGRAEEAGGESGEAVERLFGRRIEEAHSAQRCEAPSVPERTRGQSPEGPIHGSAAGPALPLSTSFLQLHVSGIGLGMNSERCLKLAWHRSHPRPH